MRKWKTCPLNRNYEISDDGLCRSKQARFEGKYLRPAWRSHTDVYVLCEKYNKKAYPIKYLVYRTFVGDVPKGYVVFWKDGERNNNHVDNLDIMPLGDKIFYFHQREKKIPRLKYTKSYFFMIGKDVYSNAEEVVKKFPNLGTRQNILNQAHRWLEKRAPRGKTWDAKGFIIRGTRIWCCEQTRKNKVKVRMDFLKQKYNL